MYTIRCGQLWLTKRSGNVNKIIQGASGFLRLRVLPCSMDITVDGSVIWLKHTDTTAGGFNYFLIRAILDSLRNFFFASQDTLKDKWSSSLCCSSAVAGNHLVSPTWVRFSGSCVCTVAMEVGGEGLPIFSQLNSVNTVVLPEPRFSDSNQAD